MKILSDNYEEAKWYEMIELECDYCHKPFKRQKKEVIKHIRKGAKRAFCSVSCSSKTKETRKIVNCKECGKETYRRAKSIEKGDVFCSAACVSRFYGKKRKKKYLCEACGKETTQRRKYCDEHFPTFNSERTIEEVEKKTTFRSGQYSNVRYNARRVAKELGKLQSCKVCKYSTYVEACHVKDINSFEKTTKISEINNPDNLVGLCPNHHTEFDLFLMSEENEDKLFEGIPEAFRLYYLEQKQKGKKKHNKIK